VPLSDKNRGYVCELHVDVQLRGTEIEMIHCGVNSCVQIPVLDCVCL
jgi:hypothetical protein